MTLLEKLNQEQAKSDDTLSTQQSSKRIKELEKQVDELERQLHRARKPRLRIRAAAPYRPNQGDFVRVVIPDTHGCFADPTALAALYGDLERLQPKEVILLGDHLDCGGFLAEHHTLGFVPDAEYRYEDDIGACNEFLDTIQRLCPDASFDYLYGNHEERVEKWALKAALRNSCEAERLRKQNAPEFVLGLEARGIKWYRSSQKYDGLQAMGTIKRGHCYFTHGHYHGKHGAYAHLGQFAGSLCHGHTHRVQSYAGRTVSGGTACAWSLGCLCILQPLYRHRNFTDWNHAYGVQFCKDDGMFSHLTVHIIDGVSYLTPVLDHLNRQHGFLEKIGV